MKVLIIGGCGHIGSVVFDYVRKIGVEADSVDAELRGNPGRIPNLCADYDTVTVEELAEYDTVIWLAGHSSVAKAVEDPHGTVSNNVIGLVHLAQKLSTQRLIYASSGSVYHKGAVNIYDASKRATDEIIPMIHKNSHALRFGTVCGASPNIRRDVMINGMVYDAMTKGHVMIKNSHVQRPILGMTDLTKSIGYMLKGEVKPGIHNLCSFNATVQQIGHQVAGECGVFLREEQGDGSYNFTMDCASWLHPQETVASIVAALKHHHGAEWKNAEVAA